MEGRARIVLLGLAAALLAAGAVAAITMGMQRGTAVAATVNGEVIYINELNEQVDTLAKQYGLDPSTADGARQRAEVSRVVLDQLIEQRLVLQEARRQSALRQKRRSKISFRRSSETSLRNVISSSHWHSATSRWPS